MLLKTNNIMQLPQIEDMKYLHPDELNSLTGTFMQYYDSKDKHARRIERSRYWLTFLVLRFTGARHRKVYPINYTADIDFRNCEIKSQTLKHHSNLKI